MPAIVLGCCQAPVVGDWVTLGHGTASVATGEYRQAVNVPLDPAVPDVAWLRVATPPCAGLMITEIEVFTTAECACQSPPPHCLPSALGFVSLGLTCTG